MNEEKFAQLGIGDYVIVKKIHNKNVKNYFTALDSVLKGDDVSYHFEEEAWPITQDHADDGAVYSRPLGLWLGPEEVDACAITPPEKWNMLDRRQGTTFFKEHKEEALAFYGKIDEASRANGSVVALLSYLDKKGWLNNAIPFINDVTYYVDDNPIDLIKTMGFHLVTPFMKFGLHVCPPYDSSTFTPGRGWHDNMDTPHVEFAFDPKGTWNEWGRCSFLGVLPFKGKTRGTQIYDVFDVMDKMHTKKGFKELYDYSKAWNQTYFE